ncbi:hypothetical protein CCP3SC1AL1_760015 [Gammaproteobacteria bacterium]
MEWQPRRCLASRQTDFFLLEKDNHTAIPFLYINIIVKYKEECIGLGEVYRVSTPALGFQTFALPGVTGRTVMILLTYV